MVQTYIIYTVKILLILGWLYFLYKTARTGSVRWVLLGTLYIGAISIGFEMLTSKVGYSLPCNGCDRAAYVGQAMTYAVGNPFGEDFAYQGIHSMYSPIYPYLVAMVHWITGFNVIKIYDIGSVIFVDVLILLFFYFGCPRDSVNSPNKKEIEWVGVLMGFFVLYLSTDPVKVAAANSYEAFWNTFILLKPGHIISFFFIPIIYLYLSKPLKWYNILIAGFAFGGMVMSFIVTAVFILCGFIVYLTLVYLFNKIDFKKETLKILLVVITGIISSIWYWLPIFADGFNIGGNDVGGSIPTTYLASSSVVFDPLEATFFMLPLFWLGIIGIIVMLNRQRKGDLLILGLVLAMYLGKFIYPISWKLFNFAPQAFESSVFFLRPAMAMAASIGVYAIIEYFLKNYEKIKEFILMQPSFAIISKTINKGIYSRWTLNKEGMVFACCLLILTPYATPVWHSSDLNNWWGGNLPPLSEKILDYSKWIKENTQYNTVFLTDGITSLRISTYTGRKLMKDRQGLNAIVNFSQRSNDAKTIFNSQIMNNETAALLQRYNIAYIMLTNDTKVEYPNINLDKFNNSDFFIKVYQKEDIMIFKVV